jgi:superfamily II helicase
MTALAERTVPVKRFTENRMLCPICQRNDNFELIVKQENSKYYLLEMCPKCQKHYEEVKEITKREASKYLILEDLA